MRPRTFLLSAAVLAFVAAGCGGSDDDSNGVQQARSEAEWATRLVPFVRRMQRNATVLNSLNNPQIKIYLYSGNPTTIRVLNQTIDDLDACSVKLDRIGRPPAGKPPLGRIYTNFRRACPHYERLAEILGNAVPLMSSTSVEDQREGSELLLEAAEPSRRAAQYYGRGLRILEGQPIFRQVLARPPS